MWNRLSTSAKVAGGGALASVTAVIAVMLTLLGSDGGASLVDPSDVRSVSHTIGERSSTNVVVME